jgi:hypothetical protein
VTERLASSRPWARLPDELAPALRARLVVTVDTLARTVSGSVPAFARIDDPKFERDVHDAVQAAVGRFVDLVGADQPALPPHVRETFVALGAAEARDDRNPEILLAALRISSRLLLRAASQALAEVRPVDTDEVLDLSDAVTAFVDELAAASTDGFAQQLREQAGERDRRRRLLAELLLRGNAPESAVLSASAGIGWSRLEAVAPVLLPVGQARDARFRYGGDGVVLEREHDAVLLLRAGPRAERRQLVEGLRGRGAVVGPVLGWTRVPEGVRLAELTLTLVREGPASPDGAADPVFADDHLATLAVRGEPGALTVLSERRLAPFAGLPGPTRTRLLQTLHSWLLHWGSRAEVASELYIHPQTVSCRIRRLRELLGDDLDDATARFELLLALADPASGSTRP